jgi:uncharacterized membrane protein (DUF2068 family)
MQKDSQSQWVLVLIGAAKLLKAILLLVLALNLHRLLNPDASKTLEAWVHHIRVDPGNRHVHALIARLTGISPEHLRELRVGSFLYAALFATEGTGLVLRQRWAEYFTTITTGLLLPLEVYEICVGHHRLIKTIVFLLNAAIVVYLVLRLRKERSGESAGVQVPKSDFDKSGQ